ARKPLVVCGAAVFRRVFERLHGVHDGGPPHPPGVRFEALHPEGAAVPAGAVIWRVHGNARALLSGERTALNLAQRMRGAAPRVPARPCLPAPPPASPIPARPRPAPARWSATPSAPAAPTTTGTTSAAQS